VRHSPISTQQESDTALATRALEEKSHKRRRTRRAATHVRNSSKRGPNLSMGAVQYPEGGRLCLYLVKSGGVLHLER